MKTTGGMVGVETSLGWNEWGWTILFQDLTLSRISVLRFLETEVKAKTHVLPLCWIVWGKQGEWHRKKKSKGEDVH